jgi:hypothetical protein
MAALLAAGARLGLSLVSLDRNSFMMSMLPVVTTYRPGNVVIRGLLLVMLLPLAEEIFWRAYLLAQLRKITNWRIALVVDSLAYAALTAVVFGQLLFPPLYWSLFPRLFAYGAGFALLCGVAFGGWRIRFRSLLPLVVAHAALNGLLVGPHLWSEFGTAVGGYAKCRKIDALAMERPAKALPALMELIADRDDIVSAHAVETLAKAFWKEGEPFVSEALRSGDDRKIDRALFAAETLRYSGLKPQVRAIVSSSTHRELQVRAIITLWELGDEDGLREIARKHPDEKIRNAAARFVENPGRG